MEPAEDKIPCSTMIIENSEGFKFCLTPPETLPAIKLVWDFEVPTGYSIPKAFKLEETKQ